MLFNKHFLSRQGVLNHENAQIKYCKAVAGMFLNEEIEECSKFLKHVAQLVWLCTMAY